MAKDISTVGDLINFRGSVYSPINEDGVVFLFGRVVDDLHMYIEEIKPAYPDCVARRFTVKQASEMAEAVETLKTSHARLLAAIQAGEPTGYFSGGEKPGTGKDEEIDEAIADKET